MKATSGALFLLALLSPTHAQRSFTDDLGVTHTTTSDKPTIVTWAHRAVTLEHYGLDESQLLGTYGEWANSGSDYDFDNLEAGSSYPADPTPEEMRLLTKVVNLSPGCKAEYCTEFNFDAFKQLDAEFILVHGYRESTWVIDNLLANITAETDTKVIYNEISLEGDDCSADGGFKDCYGKSMIDVIEDNIETAEFLNLDAPEKLDEDFARLCKSATTFQENMKVAHERGLRTMAAYLTTTTSYMAAPHHDMVLRMVEELGMPIMHVGSCSNKTICPNDYFWEWLPIQEYFTDCEEGVYSESCNTNTLYPVDFWLYDHRTTMTVANEDFTLGFPDKALIAGQMDFWPIGGRLVTPHHAANILDILGPSLLTADRLYPETECTPADVTSVAHRTSGLAGGAYACYDTTEFHNSKYFARCEDLSGDGDDIEVMSESGASCLGFSSMIVFTAMILSSLVH